MAGYAAWFPSQVLPRDVRGDTNGRRGDGGERAVRRRITTIILIWAGWTAIMLILPVLTRARFGLARPDNAVSWTAADTRRDPHAREQGLMAVLGPHAAWDSTYYLSIAQKGFDDPRMRVVAPRANPDNPEFGLKTEHPDWTSLSHAFFPLYPWMMRAVTWPLAAAGMGQPEAGLLAGVVVSMLGTLGAMLAIADMAGSRPEDASLSANPQGDAVRAAFYLLAWPGSVFLAQVYTEGLFLGLSFAALALMRRRRWAWAAVLSALAVWTRSSGALLLLPFALGWLNDGGVEGLRSRSARGLAVRNGLLACAPLFSYLAWRAVLGREFFLVESHYFGRDLLAVGRSLASYGEAWRDLMGARGPQASAYQAFEFAAVAAGAGGCLLMIRREPALALYGLAAMGFAMTSGAALGMPRYVLTVPALFLALARLGRSPAFDRLWTLAGTLGLAIFSIAFSAGFWAG